jgi:hypothetical protein
MTRKAKKEVIVRVPVPPRKPWELTAEDVELVKNHVAKGASESELAFCLGVARRYKLDPFRGQIWFVKRRDRALDSYDKLTKKKVLGYRWIPIVGINGLLHIAARDHKKEFGSISKPEYGPLVDVAWARYDEESKHYTPAGTFKAPEWARVAVWKKGCQEPTIGEVYWEEIYPNVDSAPLVRQMPRLMLGKCAKAQGLRAAYPATDGLYISEEFMVDQAEPSDNGKRSLALVEEIDGKIAKFRQLTAGKAPSEEQLSRMELGETPEEVLLKDSLEPKQEASPAPKIVWVKTMPDHDIAVSGYLPDFTQFLNDVAAVRFQSKKDGGVYWRFSPQYLEGFKALAGQFGVEIA